MKASKKREKPYLKLHGKDHKKAYYYVYFVSLGIITIIYISLLLLFSNFVYKFWIAGTISFIIGFIIEYNKEIFIKKLEDYFHNKKIKINKKENKKGFKKTMKNLVPSKRHEVSLEKKGIKWKKIIFFKNKKKQKYIEIK
jgi:hypothetical protein